MVAGTLTADAAARVAGVSSGAVTTWINRGVPDGRGGVLRLPARSEQIPGTLRLRWAINPADLGRFLAARLDAEIAALEAKLTGLRARRAALDADGRGDAVRTTHNDHDPCADPVG